MMTDAEIIKVVTARKTARIQARDLHGGTLWYDVDPPSWNFRDCDYRAAPVEPPRPPATVYVNLYSTGNKFGVAYKAETDADHYRQSNYIGLAVYRLVEVRPVEEKP